ncbi:MAG: prephenate dehydrogenase/arogenate dehydrogenase family protein [Microbacteriaceae bacterium]|nr:prephenate dehydrogenase/arogenate dehydrogenase family protein [Microbacteriaceae bacterium]MCI1207500.1 prephenate dehydrogenase/arogenate dehydrogenase family protein [Microbacteriaceae bacterium]
MTAAPASGPRPLGIVGLGLIGGSIARAVAPDGPVVAVDAAVREAPGIELVDSIGELCARHPWLIVVATPLRAMPAVFAELDAAVDAETTLADVASVKGPLLAQLDELLPRSRGQYLSLHPMAGTEFSGFSHSAPDLLTGAPWAVVPAPWGIAPERLLQVVAWLCSRFSARVHPLPAPAHDAAVALISQFPHVLANTLLALAGRSPAAAVALGLAAGSFRDGTRVAGTATARTEAMVLDNATAVIPLLEAAAASLQDTAAELRHGRPGNIFPEAEATRAHRGPTVARPYRLRADLPAVEGLLELGRSGGWITSAAPAAEGWLLQTQVPTAG